MCFGGGGRSVESYYQEIKPEPQELPSLRLESNVPRRGSRYGDRPGVPRRTLFGMGVTDGT